MYDGDEHIRVDMENVNAVLARGTIVWNAWARISGVGVWEKCRQNCARPLRAS